MPAGSAPGERRGGRKKGDRATVVGKMRAKAASSGVLPADVMLEVMRWHYDQAQEALKATRPNKRLIADRFAAAHVAARDAAPYYHPRLAALAASVTAPGKTTLEELVTSTFGLLAPANANMPEAQGPAPEASDGNFGNVTLDELFDGNTIEGVVKKG